jgi:hypothetical protein
MRRSLLKRALAALWLSERFVSAGYRRLDYLIALLRFDPWCSVSCVGDDVCRILYNMFSVSRGRPRFFVVFFFSLSEWTTFSVAIDSRDAKIHSFLLFVAVLEFVFCTRDTRHNPDLTLYFVC